MDKRINIETDERAAFEEWAAIYYRNVESYTRGNYKFGLEAWLAARATPPATGATDLPPLPGIPESLSNVLVDYKLSSDNHVTRRAVNARMILAIKDYAEQYGREAIAHYQRKQASQESGSAAES